MHEKEYNDSKKEIRSVLLTYPNPVSLNEFLNTYKVLLGVRLPSKSLGYHTDVKFLQSMPDVVTVSTGADGKVFLRGVADDKSEHIQKLVSKQRKPTGKSNNKINQPRCRLPDTSRNVGLRGTSNNVRLRETSNNVKEQKPFLPGSLKAEILQVMSANRNGLTFTAFALAYRKKFNKYLPLVRGMDTLEGMIQLIPELEIKTEGTEKKICCRGSAVDAYQVKATSPGTNGLPQEENSFDIHKSGIPEDVLHSLEMVVKKCPEGIVDIHFPPLYEKITGKSFDLHELGYNSLAELVEALPHIFKRILNPEDSRTWIILPREASLKHCFNGTKEFGTSQKNKSQLHSQEGIPSDAASPAVQYIESSLPSELDLNDYIPMFVFAIENPSLFWFQIQTDEAIEKFEIFEEDMGMFYKAYGSSKYKMKDSDIAIGATCVIFCPDDKQFYRAVIKSIPSVDLVNVLYVDYGSTENVSRNNVYYVRNKYLDYPAYAFEAKLADVKPANNESTWSAQAINRFIELTKAVLMANLRQIDKNTHLVTLCDTNGETDIYLHETLVHEGLAELCLDEQPSLTRDIPQNMEDSGNAFGNSSTTDLEGEFSSENYQSENHSPSPTILTAKRALSFTPKPQCNGVTPNMHHAVKEDSKRYIKELKLCDNTKLHFINFENKLYMSCGELSRLLWNNLDSDCLIDRLEDKQVDVPFLKLLKEDHSDLFDQCIRYQIPEFEKLKSSHCSLIIYSLEWAFNVLNIFGHPSVCLRIAIQNEIRSFDLSDSYWKEFSNEEISDFDKAVKDFQQQIRKLCLYDLNAKRQAFKITRLKLLRAQSESSNKELRKVEKFQSIIEERIQEIETICSKFSSC